MHELGIAQSLIQVLQEEISRKNIRKPIESIKMKVGKMHAIFPDSLRFHFEAISQQIPLLSKTRLEIESVPLQVYCPHCNTHQTLEVPFLSCEVCYKALQIESGEELTIESYSIPDA